MECGSSQVKAFGFDVSAAADGGLGFVDDMSILANEQRVSCRRLISQSTPLLSSSSSSSAFLRRRRVSRLLVAEPPPASRSRVTPQIRRAMARNPGCSVFIGRVVDLHIPRDKETSRPKGYAFAEYETEEIAQYAVRLFSGLVRLHNRTLRFAISGQDKPPSNGNIPVTPKLNPIMAPKPPQLMRSSDTPASQRAVVNGRIAGIGASPNHSYDVHSEASSGVLSRGLSSGTYEYSRRVFGSVMNDCLSALSCISCDLLCKLLLTRFTPTSIQDGSVVVYHASFYCLSTELRQIQGTDTERQPQTEKKAPRPRPMPAKIVIVM
ncbi:hypothetical protein GUJ93_ZPchr0010g9874 [Zizania palustris]|uniref:RRM domain-containing protein n=1 Tax=Zizania palustris TaxID=103762 RepID=A0A8J5WAI6_ZIZPA|nr:hypothetical protein GUJ93_ZPchr0010g9874 [Zizania palustris]